MKKEFKKFCRETIKELFSVSELNYRYWIKFSNVNEEDMRWADNSISSKHFESFITIYPMLEDKYNEGDLEYVVNTLAHEVAHCYTQQTYELTIKASKGLLVSEWLIEEQREIITQQIGNLLQRLLTRKAK